MPGTRPPGRVGAPDPDTPADGRPREPPLPAGGESGGSWLLPAHRSAALTWSVPVGRGTGQRTEADTTVTVGGEQAVTGGHAHHPAGTVPHVAGPCPHHRLDRVHVDTLCVEQSSLQLGPESVLAHVPVRTDDPVARDEHRHGIVAESGPDRPDRPGAVDPMGNPRVRTDL